MLGLSVHYSVFITEALMMMMVMMMTRMRMVMVSLRVPAAALAADYVLNFIFLAGPVASVEEL